MKIYLREIPNTPEDEIHSDITRYVKKINKRSETLKTGQAELKVSDFTLEIVNDNAVFSEIMDSGFFPDGNAFKIPIYLVDEKLGTITDAGIIRKIEENVDKELCTITVTSPIAELDKVLVCDLENVTPPETVLRTFEILELDTGIINLASFELAKNYYQNNSISLSIHLTRDDSKNGFNLVNEIVEMTGDSIYLQNNVIYYYLNKEYNGNGGLFIPESELMGNIKLFREDGLDVFTKVRYKISASTTYQLDISNIEEWEAVKNQYQQKEHYRDYSGDKIQLNVDEPAFSIIAKKLLFKKSDRKLIAEFCLPIKFSFLKIGQIINFTLKSRKIFSEPFEIIYKELDYDNLKMRIRCSDLNMFPKLFPYLTFTPPKPVENFAVWANGTHVSFSWLPVTTDVQGNPITISNYKIYYGIFSGNYESSFIEAIGKSPLNVSGEQSEFNSWDFTPGEKFYFSISAVSAYLIESELSHEISCLTGTL